VVDGVIGSAGQYGCGWVLRARRAHSGSTWGESFSYDPLGNYRYIGWVVEVRSIQLRIRCPDRCGIEVNQRESTVKVQAGVK